MTTGTETSETETSVELWATSPVPLPVKPLDGYGPYIDLATCCKNDNVTVMKKSSLHHDQDLLLQSARNTLHEWGILSHRQVLKNENSNSGTSSTAETLTNINENDKNADNTNNSLERWRQLVSRRIDEIDDALHKYQPHLRVGMDSFHFLEIASRNQQRFDLRLVGTEVDELVHRTILQRPLLADNGEIVEGEEQEELVDRDDDVKQMTAATVKTGVHDGPVTQRPATIRDFIQSVLRRKRGPATGRRRCDDENGDGNGDESNRYNLDDCDYEDESDDDFDFDVSVVYSRPGAPEQGWHADGKHLPGDNDAGNWLDPTFISATVHDDVNESAVAATTASKTSSTDWLSRLPRPYAICLFIPLIDLNEKVGYTQFWPGSHRNREIAGFGQFCQVTQSIWNNDTCKAGDGVWYDYRLLHQGMANHIDSNTQRPIVQIIFKRKWYVERDNYGLSSVYHCSSLDSSEKEEKRA